MHMPVWQSADARWVKPPGSITGLLAAACRIGIAAGLLLLGEAVHPVDAQPVEDPVPDQIMVKDQILNVRIIRFDASGVTYRSEFGKGEITTAYTDLEGVSSRSAFRIVYGEDNEAVGRLLGFRDNRLLIGDSPSTIIHVPVEGIQVCVLARDYYGSRWTRLRTDCRHWNADLSLGVNYEQGAVEKRKLEIGLSMARRKRPTRFVFGFRYAYEIEKTVDTPERTTKDEFDTYLLGEVDVSRKVYLFIRPAAERDLPRLIESRTYPAAGIGYRLVDKENRRLLFPIGIGYVSEEFIGFGPISYTSAYVGIEGLYEFSNGMALSGEALYMPELSDPGRNWLFRWMIDFAVPIYDPLALRLRIREENDNNPDPAVGDNKFTTSLAMIFRF
ncbi:MAG: hypothetical protein AMJ54_02885 [Deltaproteobacteria bacterium SG8_13]|nr:MAG: hypothetical protein AMJ54_02885 [Deltaproteobacteria bacterium SG8_13]